MSQIPHKLVLMSALMLFFYPVFTQTVNALSLQECYRMAQEAHPLQRQFGVLRQSTALRQEQIDAARLPDLQWNARARLQSDVVKFPLEFPGVAIPQLPLYSVQSTVDAAYVIADGGMAAARRAVEQAALPAEEQAVSVELEQLKPRINELFFGILLLREREAVLQNNLDNLNARRATVDVAIRLGAALPGDADRLQVEALRIETRMAETQSEQAALLHALSSWIQAPLAADAALELPVLDAFTAPAQRAEYRLFDLQKQRIAAAEGLIAAGNKPRLSAWAQAGLGYPNPFNFFDNDLSPFAAVGLAFTWRIHDWKQAARERELLTLQTLGIDHRRAALDRQLEAQEAQLRRQIEDMAALSAKDEQVVALQTRILVQVQNQLEHGTATATDYIEQQNAVMQAQLNLQSRRVQLQLLKVNLMTLKGLL